MALGATSVTTRFLRADIAVVGVVNGVHRVSDVGLPGPRHPTLPSREDGVKLYACEITLTVALTIKGNPQLGKGQRLGFLWYLSSWNCEVPRDFRGNDRGTAVWLLCKDKGLVRALEDDVESRIDLYGLTSTAAKGSMAWEDPALRFAYLVFSPGVGLPASPQHYYISASTGAFGNVVNLIGWSGWFRVLSKLYRDGDSSIRSAICLVAGEVGVCLACAREATARGWRPVCPSPTLHGTVGTAWV